LEQNNNHIIYNAQDIHRYFSGKMDAAEMHAMEKASLNDPLLAEAMDGYHELSAINTPDGYAAIQSQLDALRDKISGKTVPLKKRTNTWWKIAAAVLLLISGAYALYRMNNKSEVRIAQKNDSAKVINPVTSTSPAQDTVSAIVAQVNTDSISGLKTATVKNYAAATSQPKPIPLAYDSVKNIAMNEKKEATAQRDLLQNYSASSATLPPAQQEYAANNNKVASSATSFLKKTTIVKSTLFQGKVTDADNNPIPYAELIINNHQQSKTDAKGFFNLTSSDSLIRLDVSAVNYYPKTITLNANNTAAIQLTPKKTTLHKNLLDTTLHLSTVQLLYNGGVEPKEGWEQYRLYLVNQLSNSVYDDGRKVVGETIVQFEINRINQPSNFYFEKSIDEDVNNAIENLILLQTEWRFLPSAGVPAKVRLRIVF